MGAPFEPIPIKLIDAAGCPASNLDHGEPCISIGFRLQHNNIDATKEIEFQRTLALIDTGCGITMFDESFVTKFRGTAVAKGTTLTIGSAAPFHGYFAAIYIPEWEHIFRMDAITGDLSKKGAPWSVILGRNFLSHARLILERSGGRIERC